MATATLFGSAMPFEQGKTRLVEKGGGYTFTKLPDEIIEQILHVCDPNSFASLILLNSTWRRVSQRGHLYAHHLSHCPSYAASHPPIPSELIEGNLPLLRSAFAREVKRNLFEAYLRPHETVVNLVSTSISSSAAFPGGEAFHFVFSPKGHHVLAYSSSRIYVINTAEKELAVKRELGIQRRPASVAILDDASLLAVLSTDHQVDVYNLRETPPKHAKALALDHAPQSISLSSTGSVLSAAYEAGVEVYSLSANASSTDRRSVKCDPADSLSFSDDGTRLLGTTLASKNPSTVILTAPYYDPGDCPPEESVSHLWTTSILFPHSSRDCSHAILLPSPLDDETSWAFTYDRVFETFRAVRIDDLRNGTTYFTGPVPDLASGSKLLPNTLPTATGTGDLVAAGFQGKEIWLYGVPEDLDSSSDTSQTTINNMIQDVASPTGSLARSNSGPSIRSHTWPRDPTSNRIPQWQLLCDKSRNTFIEGRNISLLKGITALKWVSGKPQTSCEERLVVVAPGVVGQLSESDEDGIAPIDGGRFSVLDFDYQSKNGGKTIITIEVGENEPEVLEEEHRDMETEVAIVRRRTVAQRGHRPNNVLRATTVALGPGQTTSRATAGADVVPPLPVMRVSPSNFAGRLPTTEEQPETASIASLDEAQEALDAPYAHGSPRSGTTLRRAATAAAINRRLHPPRVVGQEHIEFRRADGREEHPHESDADNWVPPPPPYSREPVAPLPAHLRNAVLAGSVSSGTASNLRRSSTQRSSSSTDSNLFNVLQRSRSTYVPASPGRQSNLTSPRAVSDPTRLSTGNNSPEINVATLADGDGFDDIYDVSPPDTPPPAAARPATSAIAAPGVPAPPSAQHQIPRRPVASTSTVVAEPSSPPAAGVNHLEPQSPIPQHSVSGIQGPENRMLEQWEGMVEPAQNLEISRPSTGSSLTQARLDAPVPSRPNEGHRLTQLLPSTPVKTPPSSALNQNVPNIGGIQSSPTEFQTTPATVSRESTYGNPPTNFSGPSPSQLARLSSRSGRPSSRVLTDPSRRWSGTFVQPPFVSPIQEQNPPRNFPATGTYPQYPQYPQVYPHHAPHVFAPPTIPMNPGPPMQPPNGYYPPNMQPRPVNPGYSRQVSSGSSGSRPRMQRLETIHSIASQGDPAAYVRPANIGRKPSRAERSAAINIAQAKRKGWGTTKKKKKHKDRDGASSAGWTDVTRDSFGEETGKRRGGKCVLM